MKTDILGLVFFDKKDKANTKTIKLGDKPSEKTREVEGIQWHHQSSKRRFNSWKSTSDTMWREFCLPHKPVLREGAETMKLRVVHNVSVKPWNYNTKIKNL